MNFFKTYKYFIIAPIVVVAIAIGAILMLTDSKRDAPFIYAIF